MGKVIGIDFGYDYVVAAIPDGQQIRVLNSKDGKTATRSIVSLKRREGKDDEILVGEEALANWLLAPKDTIISIKRLIGRGFDDPEVQRVRSGYLYDAVKSSDGTKDSVRVVMGGKQYSPVQISAMILKKVKEDAEFHLGEEVTDAVITVPAYFSQAQNAATRLAGQQAGLRVIHILYEPTAAAIAYGADSEESSEPKYILVCDMGSGTLDISVLIRVHSVFAPLTLEGDMWLGGDDFDQVLVDHAIRHIQTEYGLDPRPNLCFMAMLKKVAQEAKEQLGFARTTEITIPGALLDSGGNMIDVEMEITQKQYEDIIRPIIRRTLLLVVKTMVDSGLWTSHGRIGRVMETSPGIGTECILDDGREVRRTWLYLNDCQSSASHVAGVWTISTDVHQVCILNKAAREPFLLHHVGALFDKAKTSIRGDIEYPIAEGAARFAAVLGDRTVCQAPDPADTGRECEYIDAADVLIPPGPIAPFCYGIQTAGDGYDIFIRRGDPYPTPKENRKPQTFYTRKLNQRIINIPIYGGDYTERASANEKQGEAVVILPPGLPAGTPVTFTMWLNIDGIFELTAHLQDGTDLNPWITKGEADQKAIEMLQQVDQDFEKVENELEPSDREELERVREDAYEDMKSRQFDRAIQRAEEFREKLCRRRRLALLRKKVGREFRCLEMLIALLGKHLSDEDYDGIQEELTVIHQTLMKLERQVTGLQTGKTPSLTMKRPGPDDL